MSLEYEEQMIDRISSKVSGEKLTNYEIELEKLQHDKQELMMQQNKAYLEELFKNNKSAPINIRNVQITNSGSFRDSFLEAQFKPLLLNNLMTLENLLDNVDIVTKRLVKLNIIENLMVSFNPVQKSIFTKNKSSIDMVPIFNILPAKRFYAKTGTNIGNGEGDGYIQFQLKNLFGGGEGLAFDAVTGTKTQSSYLLKYDQPVLNNSDYIFETSGFVNTRNFDWINSEVNVKGFTNKIYTQFDSPLNHEFLVENCWKTLKNIDSKADDVLAQSGSSMKSSIIYNFKFDTRDSSHLASKGLLLRLGLEYSGLFQFNKYPFIKSVLEGQYAIKLNSTHHMIFTSKYGMLYPLNSTSSILDRFFIGGPNDVRSFTLNGLSPKSYNSSIGGDLFMNGGVSLVSNIPGVSKDSNFKIHNFLNFGKIGLLDKNVPLSKSISQLTKEFSSSYGIGLLYNHPMARFELNIVLPLTIHERDGVRKGLQYGIGMSFL